MVQPPLFTEYNNFGIMASMPGAVTATDTFRILLYNVGYFTELDGSLRNYFLRFYRYLYTPSDVVTNAMTGLDKLIHKENPDLCCFIELKKKGRRPHLHAYRYGDVENKYGFDSVLRRVPFFRSNCNGFLAKKPLHYHRRYFQHGTKKLFYEIEIEHGVSLLLVHFSLRASTRTKQFEELRELIATRKNVVVCGDFNTFRHFNELQNFADDCSLRIVNKPSEATFPAKKPTKAIDFFLCSKTLKMKNAKVIRGIKISDHLPVMVEMEL